MNKEFVSIQNYPKIYKKPAGTERLTAGENLLRKKTECPIYASAGSAGFSFSISTD